MSFFPDTLTELRLEILPEIQHESWQQSQSASNPTAQWNTYLNQVCLHTVLPWLQSDYAPEAVAWAGSLPLLGELVRGTAIALRDRRLILIPDKTIDTSELRVPQEWVDSPTWAGDYYLAVQVDPDDRLVRVWGYATHEQIKISGNFDAADRTYALDAHQMVQDISALWVVRQLYPDELTQAAIVPLPALPPAQAENLLQRLANPAVLQPRLELPFQLWAALIANDGWQQQLGRSRRGESAPTPTPILANLSQWLQNRVDASWQTLESLLGAEAELAFNFRQAADPDQRCIRRAKRLRLPDQDTLLLVTVEPEADERVSIQPQLRPLNPTLCLPAHLSLTLLLATGEAVQSVQTRDRDNIIQLKRFKCPLNTQFSLQVAIGNTVITEDFVV